jgi:hypothetical protein
MCLANCCDVIIQVYLLYAWDCLSSLLSSLREEPRLCPGFFGLLCCTMCARKRLALFAWIRPLLHFFILSVSLMEIGQRGVEMATHALDKSI